MKKGILALLGACALSSGGCFTGDDPEGRFSLTWSITIDGFPGQCDEVGGATVEVIATHLDSGDEFVDLFDCEDFGATTSQVPAGPYEVEISLLDGAGVQLNAVPIILDPDVFDDETVSLGNFEFAFSFPQLSFRVQMGGAQQSNCTENGAGVSNEEIRVSDAAATQCLPFDLLVESTTQATCSRLVCYENNVTHTVAGLQAGNYLLQVLGYKGATGPDPYICYVSDTIPFTVGSSDVNLGLVVAPFSDQFDPVRCNATKPGSSETDEA